MTEKKIVVITDSSAYIPDSALAGLNIPVIPLWLLWEGENLRDGVDIRPSAFYKRLQESKVLPTSSQPTVPEAPPGRSRENYAVLSNSWKM